MITRRPPPPGDSNRIPMHNLKCTKSIGGFEEGNSYACNVFEFAGRQYEPGKNELTGKWNDAEGRPETRVSILNFDKMKTFADLKEAEKYFTETA